MPVRPLPRVQWRGRPRDRRSQSADESPPAATTVAATVASPARDKSVAAAVVRGSYHSVVVVDMPFGSYEQSPQQAFESATFLLKQSGAAAVKLEGGAQMAAKRDQERAG